MRIDSVQNMKKIQNKEEIKVDKSDKIDRINPSTKENTTPAAVFESSDVEDKGHVYDKSTIDRLKKDSEKSYENLKRIVDSLIRRQGKAMNLSGKDQMIEIDAATRAEAGELISANGPLGVEAVSDSIVDFAIAVSGGDKAKLETLRNAIDKGFKEAERILGTLPQISLDTHDRIMEKLDNWEKE